MNPSRRFDLFICIALIFATFAIYWQLSTHDFVIIDDPVYVSNNEYVKKGLTIQSVKWSFTTFFAEFWHPLTWISLMLDTQLYGVMSGGYLFTNLLFHTLNSILLFFVFRKMTGAIWQSAFVAALFALHPLHVESVAWIAMRKDVLSTFFAFLAILSYIFYLDNLKKAKYFFMIFFFILGLMAKPMIVTLPFVLILIDFWPIKRLQLSTEDRINTLLIKRSFFEKIPLFLIALVISIVTYYAQKTGGGVVPLKAVSLSGRIANAVVSYTGYIEKMVWPNQLAVFYPFNADLPVSHVGLSLIVFLLISYFAVKLYKQYPYIIFGWLWYLGTLFPVIGLVKIGDFSMADRYTYVPLIGLFTAISWGIPSLLKNWKFKKIGLILGVGMIFTLLSFVTFKQVGYWKDSVTLFRHAIHVTENNYLAHWGLGNALSRNEKIDEAIEHFKEAAHIKPKRVDFHNDLGRALAQSGRFEESISSSKQAIKLKPDYANAYFYLGLAMVGLGRYDKALDNFFEAFRLWKGGPDTINPLVSKEIDFLYKQALKLEEEGKIELAISQYVKLLHLDPYWHPATYRLARLYIEKGKYQNALSLFEIKISPEWLKTAAEKGYSNWYPIRRNQHK